MARPQSSSLTHDVIHLSDQACELCGRHAPTTEHHLIPRSRRRQNADAFGPTARVCHDCHRTIHATFDNRHLARELNTIPRLREAPELARYLAWIRNRPGTQRFGVRTRRR
jgi:hypothetical protein